VFEDLVLRVPQQGQDRVLHPVGDGLHLRGLGLLADQPVRGGGGLGVGVDVGAFDAFVGAVVVVEGDGVGVVAGHGLPVVFDEAVVVAVVGSQLPVDVFLCISGEISEYA